MGGGREREKGGKEEREKKEEEREEGEEKRERKGEKGKGRCVYLLVCSITAGPSTKLFAWGDRSGAQRETRQTPAGANDVWVRSR